jgi:xanthine dehydrogenase accessory factor
MINIYKNISAAVEKGEGVVLCTVIETHGSTPRHAGSKMLIYENGNFEGSVGGGEVENRVIKEAGIAIVDGKSRVLSYSMVNPAEGDPGICGGTVEVLIEPILPKPTILIIGGGHVGRAVAHLAKWLGFRIVISDDRPEMCTPEANPDADLFLACEMNAIPKNFSINPYTYVVLATRGHDVDVTGVPFILKTPAAYIGIIGSKRRWTMTRKVLEAQGISPSQLDRVFSPVGLELQAETPEEIAVSIMGEIIMLRNGGTGSVMKMK